MTNTEITALNMVHDYLQCRGIEFDKVDNALIFKNIQIRTTAWACLHKNPHNIGFEFKNGYSTKYFHGPLNCAKSVANHIELFEIEKDGKDS